MTGIEKKQAVEIDFWRTSEAESPESDSIDNVINKVSDASVLLQCLDRHKDKLVASGNVLELGGGQGWASCVYKRLYPDTCVTTTDISPHAVASVPKWERIFNVRVDNVYACTSYETKEPDASIDLVFCFAAAHHFLAHRRTLREIHRVLKPAGTAIYFHEPVTPKHFYRLAFWRVNRKRPSGPEDVLIPATLRRLAGEVGLEFRLDYFPSLGKRGRLETAYYFILSRLRILQRLIPASANVIFVKESGSPTPSASSHARPARELGADR